MIIEDFKDEIEFLIWKNIDRAPNFLIKTWQNHRLRKLVTQHFLYNPFYNELLKGCGINFDDIAALKIEDIFKLPVISKDEFRKFPLEQLASANIAPERFISDSTSGSTGEPFNFLRDRKYETQSRILTFKILRDLRITTSSRMVALRLITPPASPNVLQVSGLDLYNDSKNRDLIEQILDFKGEAIFGFPSFLSEFCELLKKFNFSFEKPLFKAAVSSAETLDRKEREFIEDTLGCEVLDRYGSEELWGIAEDCKYHNGFHLYPESHFLEVIDDNGNPLPPGKEGRIVVTYFDNDIMPFIRYDTGDRGMTHKDRCPCGNNSLFFSLIGRRPFSKIWLMKNGQKISSRLFYLVFLDLADKILRYQAVKKSDAEILLRVVPGKNFTSSAIAELETKIREHVNFPEFKISFDLVDKIVPAPHGKREDFADESE